MPEHAQREDYKIIWSLKTVIKDVVMPYKPSCTGPQDKVHTFTGSCPDHFLGCTYVLITLMMVCAA